jgi:hypothetical protein
MNKKLYNKYHTYDNFCDTKNKYIMYKYQDYNGSPSYMYCMWGTGFYSHVEWRFRPIEIVKHTKLPVPSQESEWSCIYDLLYKTENSLNHLILVIQNRQQP